MRPEPSPERDLTAPACIGVLTGMAAALALEVCDALPGVFQDADPFVYMIAELVVFSAGGAALFIGIALVRERFRHRSARRKQP